MIPVTFGSAESCSLVNFFANNLVFLSPIVNPLLYSMMGSRFRQTMKESLNFRESSWTKNNTFAWRCLTHTITTTKPCKNTIIFVQLNAHPVWVYSSLKLLTLRIHILECFIIEGFQIDLITHVTEQETACTSYFLSKISTDIFAELHFVNALTVSSTKIQASLTRAWFLGELSQGKVTTKIQIF